MKKFLLILLGVLICLPIYARDFKYPYEGHTLTYTVISETDKTVKTKEGSGKSNAGNKITGELKIPSVVENEGVEYTVIEIGAYAFSNLSGLISVTIPNSVKKNLRRCFPLLKVAPD